MFTKAARFIVIALVSVLMLTSCGATLPTRFENFSARVERNGDTYSLHKWEWKTKKFERLCKQYKDYYPIYTASQRRSIRHSMVSYVKSAAKAGVINLSDTVNDVVDEFTDIVKDIKDLLQDIGIVD